MPFFVEKVSLKKLWTNSLPHLLSKTPEKAKQYFSAGFSHDYTRKTRCSLLGHTGWNDWRQYSVRQTSVFDLMLTTWSRVLNSRCRECQTVMWWTTLSWEGCTCMFHRFCGRSPSPPALLADPHAVRQAVSLLFASKKPLVIVGKGEITLILIAYLWHWCVNRKRFGFVLLAVASGAAYGRAEKPIREFIERHKLPFLPTPMGKGVLPDDHPLCIAAARSKWVFRTLTLSAMQTFEL